MTPDAPFATHAQAAPAAAAPYLDPPLDAPGEIGLPADQPHPVQPAAASRTRGLVGSSPELGRVRQAVNSVADRVCTVLLRGETGVGKEMVARHLHSQSDRVAGPFIPVDCSSLSDTLFESQMFGHVRGAFTGAVRDGPGFFRAAHGGTLFLDEIGELTPAHQAKLLRAIQERAVVPVGEVHAVPVDVRIVCATHRDLEEMIRQRQFRDDLYFRLAVVTLDIPPLRQRGRDIIALAEHFLRAQAELYGEGVKLLEKRARSMLVGYDWPGNVRELANVMEYAHVMSPGPLVTADDLPPRLRAAMDMDDAPDPTNAAPPELCLAAAERRIISEALSRTGGNKTAASRLLGIHVQKLNRRLRKLGL